MRLIHLRIVLQGLFGRFGRVDQTLGLLHAQYLNTPVHIFRLLSAPREKFAASPGW